MKFSSLLPEELRNAQIVNRELADVARASQSNSVYLAFNLSVFLVGACLSIFGSDFVDEGLLNAIIAFSGLIFGFVITAMLFSGRSQFVGKLTYEQTLLYVLKTKYILMSQINTLFAFLMCLVFCLITMLAIKTKLYLDRDIAIFLASGFFFMGCYRMLILPFQIYDIHSFALNNLIDDSAEEVRSGVRAASEARREKLAKLGR
ncbi:hypothetical protein IB245_20670 [Pseudomonas sp. PDM02]|uniref:hypothetical protein n=1 Tax=Pseudomonas sp. PDM02 TaxID=2769267 RepID=UPI001782CD2F|nr:hypothetical protein [Pseudomonas sp. PDM02]MBD9613920.1 hypothetical protein [Pseudomonas sp. PDM02]